MCTFWVWYCTYASKKSQPFLFLSLFFSLIPSLFLTTSLTPLTFSHYKWRHMEITDTERYFSNQIDCHFFLSFSLTLTNMSEMNQTHSIYKKNHTFHLLHEIHWKHALSHKYVLIDISENSKQKRGSDYFYLWRFLFGP